MNGRLFRGPCQQPSSTRVCALRLAHASRVRWRDRAWEQLLCDHRGTNPFCLLLKNIRGKRDDEYEVASAEEDIGVLKAEKLPCLSERGTFMPRNRYSVTKEHPYRITEGLMGHREPTTDDRRELGADSRRASVPRR